MRLIKIKKKTKKILMDLKLWYDNIMSQSSEWKQFIFKSLGKLKIYITLSLVEQIFKINDTEQEIHTLI